MIIGLVVVISLIAIGLGIYKYRTTTGTIETMDPIFASAPVTQTAQHSVFMEDIYVGKSVKLDPTLKFMVTNVLFAFPTTDIVIESFNYLDIDGNKLEVINCKSGGLTYIIVDDTVEDTTYFFQKLMTSTGTEEDCAIVDDKLNLTENGQTYTYEDISGLIKAGWSDKATSSNRGGTRLVRLYEREVTPEYEEKMLLMMPDTTTLVYYMGFAIERNQLENI